jgi:hypothetical protein
MAPGFLTSGVAGSSPASPTTENRTGCGFMCRFSPRLISAALGNKRSKGIVDRIPFGGAHGLATQCGSLGNGTDSDEVK